jgi:hypothetical protein
LVYIPPDVKPLLADEKGKWRERREKKFFWGKQMLTQTTRSNADIGKAKKKGLTKDLSPKLCSYSVCHRFRKSTNNRDCHNCTIEAGGSATWSETSNTSSNINFAIGWCHPFVYVKYDSRKAI